MGYNQVMGLDDFLLDNPDTPLPNTEIAATFGVSEATVRRRRIKLGLPRSSRYTAPPTQPPPQPFEFDIPDEIVTSRGISKRLPDGSWEKITYRPQDWAKVEYQKTVFQDVLAQLQDPPTNPTNTQTQTQTATTPTTLVICLADFQTGKTDYLGGTPELIARVQNVYDQITSTLSALRHPYQEIILVDVGDILEGFGNTVQQQQTNDLSLTDQIRTAQALILEAIRRFYPYAANNLTYVSVPSNHCQVRTKADAKARANKPNDDFGLLIQDNIKQVLDHNPELYPNLYFVQPESPWDESVTVTAQDGTTLGVTHGHLANSPLKVGEWFAGQAFGRRANLQNADMLLHGHFHSFSISLTGDNRFVICAPTIDNGSSWFSNRTGKSSDPAILTFELRDHRPDNWRMYYPDPNPQL